MSKRTKVATAGLVSVLQLSRYRNIGNIPVSRRTRGRAMAQRVIPEKVAIRATRAAGSGVSVQVWGMALLTEHLGLLP